MKVVVLCGGLGTRLREETEYRPKTMVEIGGRPILLHIMKSYAHYGFMEFVLCLGYRGDQIKDYFVNYEARSNDFTVRLGRNSGIEYHHAHEEQDFLVTLAETGQHSMTGGRLRRIRPYITEGTFMVTYGDGLSNVDLGAVLKFHKSHGKIATVTAVTHTSRFGVLDLEGNGEVIKFAEKPRLSGWINAGFFVFDRKLFDYLDGDSCILEAEPLMQLAREGQLMAYRHEGFFESMDTYRDYQHLESIWSSGKPPWKVWPS